MWWERGERRSVQVSSVIQKGSWFGLSMTDSEQGAKVRQQSECCKAPGVCKGNTWGREQGRENQEGWGWQPARGTQVVEDLFPHPCPARKMFSA